MVALADPPVVMREFVGGAMDGEVIGLRESVVRLEIPYRCGTTSEGVPQFGRYSYRRDRDGRMVLEI